MKGWKNRGLAGIIIMCMVMISVVGSKSEVTAVAKNTTLEAATSISIGKKVSGSISEIGDSLYYAFTTGSDLAYYKFSASTSSKESEFDICVEDTDEVVVEQFSFSKEESGSMELELERGKKYYVVVTLGSAESTAAFSFSSEKIKDDYGNDVESASDLTFGKNINGKLDKLGDIDMFKFTALKERVYYQFELSTTDATEDLLLEVLDAEESVVDSVVASKEEANYVVCQLEAGNVYYVRVQTNGDEQKASYTLKPTYTVDVEEDTIEQASTILLGQQVSGSLQSETDIDCFAFKTASNISVYKVIAYSNAGEGNGISVEVRDEDDTAVEGFQADGSEEGRVEVELEKSKTYYLVVTGDLSGIRYSITVCVSGDIEPIPSGFEGQDQTTTTDEPFVAPVNSDKLILSKRREGLFQTAGGKDKAYFSINQTGIYELTIENITIEDNLVVDVIGGDGSFIRKVYLSKEQTAQKLFEFKAGMTYYLSIYTETNQGVGYYATKVKLKLATEEETVSQPVTTKAPTTSTAVVSPKSFRLSKTSLKIKCKKTKKLSVVYTPKKAKIKKLTWTSDNKKVASVSKKGLVKGVKNGNTKIACKVVFQDGTKKTLICKVKVTK